MWCEKCHYGSEKAKLTEKCIICNHTTFVDKNPFPKKPIRSIRCMERRKYAPVDEKTNKVMSEEITEVIQEAATLK